MLLSKLVLCNLKTWSVFFFVKSSKPDLLHLYKTEHIKSEFLMCLFLLTMQNCQASSWFEFTWFSGFLIAAWISAFIDCLLLTMQSTSSLFNLQCPGSFFFFPLLQHFYFYHSFWWKRMIPKFLLLLYLLWMTSLLRNTQLFNSIGSSLYWHSLCQVQIMLRTI